MRSNERSRIIMKLWQIGLLVVIITSVVNGFLVKYEVGGIIRELARLVILLGLGLLIYGLFKRAKK